LRNRSGLVDDNTDLYTIQIQPTSATLHMHIRQKGAGPVETNYEGMKDASISNIKLF